MIRKLLNWFRSPPSKDPIAVKYRQWGELPSMKREPFGRTVFK